MKAKKNKTYQLEWPDNVSWAIHHHSPSCRRCRMAVTWLDGWYRRGGRVCGTVCQWTAVNSSSAVIVVVTWLVSSSLCGGAVWTAGVIASSSAVVVVWW
jgi:hypothetical protein